MSKNLMNNEVDQSNLQTITRVQLKDAGKAKFEAHMK
jgi:hypothetical protein